MSEGKRLRFMFGGTRKLEVGKTINIDTGMGYAEILVTQELTREQAITRDRLTWDKITRSLPPGVEIHWYEGEAEQCQKEDTNHPERTGAHGTN